MVSRPVADEEEEAVHDVRIALQNRRGTSMENRERVASAWQTLRSVANSSEVQSKSNTRRRKRNKLEKRVKKKAKYGDTKSNHADLNADSSIPLKEEAEMLHHAARLGQEDRVRELITLGSRVSSKDHSGYSALHWASLYGHVEVVKLLLRSGAGDGKRINRQNDAGNTALHLACLGRHALVAAALEVYKPDEYLKNAYDQSPVSLGLRELLASVQKIQRLDDLQAERPSSHQRLLQDSLDWQMEMEDRYAEASASSDITKDKFAGKKRLRGLWGDWEEYDAAWKGFLDRFSQRKQDGTSNELNTGTAGAMPVNYIYFEDVPWPVSDIQILRSGSRDPGRGTQGNEQLLLAELGVKGPALRPLIQSERLRWHPDKFVQSFGNILAPEDEKTILAGVQTVCQLLNSMADRVAEVPGE